MVDNDHKQFTLWKSQQSRESNLIPIGPPACNSPVLTPNSQPPFPLPDPSSHKSVPKGAIAGGVVGGLVAIALCIAALFLLKRNRHRHQVKGEEEQRRQAEAMQAEAAKNSLCSDNPTHWKPEMPSNMQPPQEMPLEQDTGYDTAPYELQTLETYEMPTTAQSRRHA